MNSARNSITSAMPRRMKSHTVSSAAPMAGIAASSTPMTSSTMVKRMFCRFISSGTLRRDWDALSKLARLSASSTSTT